MKISVSLPEEDIQFLDHQFPNSSRSAALHAAIDALRHEGLRKEYEEAFAEWTDSPDAELWETATSDSTRY
jgi:Arc/MetJ-type ribon-helix-helix transcriptional regulator